MYVKAVSHRHILDGLNDENVRIYVMNMRMSSHVLNSISSLSCTTEAEEMRSIFKSYYFIFRKNEQRKKLF